MNNLSNITGVLNELNLAIEGSELNTLNQADIKELIDNLLVVIVDRFHLQELESKNDMDDSSDEDVEKSEKESQDHDDRLIPVADR